MSSPPAQTPAPDAPTAQHHTVESPPPGPAEPPSRPATAPWHRLAARYLGLNPRQRRRALVVMTSAAAAVVLGLVAAVAFTGGDAEDKPAGTSANPATLALPAVNGSGTIRLSDYQGKAVVVRLFASWCDVCHLDLPAYKKLSEELDGRVQFVGVASMETGDPNLLPKTHGLTWPLARDIGQQGSDLHDALAPGYGMPVTAFYDASGKLRYIRKGGLLEDDLRATLNRVYGGNLATAK
jgi:thiol-disulfide isomerase/thioredoxin